MPVSSGFVTGGKMTQNNPTRILRCRDLQVRLNLSRSCIYDKLSPTSPRHDPTFPRALRLGANAVGWVEAEVEIWLETRLRGNS